MKRLGQRVRAQPRRHKKILAQYLARMYRPHAIFEAHDDLHQ